MEVVVINTKEKRNIKVEIPDEIATDVEDVRVMIGMELFELKSTKTEEDKQRERLSVEFGEEYYSQIYDQHPEFRDLNTTNNGEEFMKLILSMMEQNPHYQPLVDDKDRDALLRCLLVAFSNFCQVRDRMEKENEEIRKNTLDENVFYDYIKRFKQAFQTATCLKELNDAIVLTHRHACMDARNIFGYTFISECMTPFFNKIKSIESELSEMKPQKTIKELPMWEDTAYWQEYEWRSIINEVVENFNRIEKKFRTYEEEHKTSTFEEFAKKIIESYTRIEEENKSINVQINTWKKDNNVTTMSDDDVRKMKNDLSDSIRSMTESFKSAITNIATIQVEFHLALKENWKPGEAETIDANFCVVDYYMTEINKSKEKFSSIASFISQLDFQMKILQKCINHELDPGDIMNGKYSNQELKELVYPSQDHTSK